MAGDSIATAYVTIKPDLTGFRDDLRAGLDEAVAGIGDKTVRINADTAEAEAKVASFDGSLDALGDRTATPKVTLDDGRALTELEVLQARIDELSSESATIKIGTTGQTRKDLTDLQSALDSFRNETLVPSLDPARLEAINGELDGLDYKLRTVDSDLQSTASSGDKAASALGKGGAGDSGGGLLTMALAALPVLESVGAVGAGAMASVAVASTAATVGIGAFALAAQPALQGAKTQAQELLSTWQQTEAGFTSPVIVDALSLLPGVFNLLSPSVATTSHALQGLEGDLANSLGSPYWRQFSQYIAGEGGAAISSFGTLVGGLATLFSGLAEGLAPELQTIEGDVGRWAQDLDKWGQEAANGGLSSFVSYLQQNGPLVAHALEQIGSDIVTLARASAPLGPVWLNIIDVAAKLLGELEELNPTLTTWAVGLGSVALAANRLSAPIGGLTGLLTASKSAWSLASDGFAVGATGLYAVAAASDGAVGSVAGLLPALLPIAEVGLPILGAALLQSTGAFSNFDAAANAAGKSWSQNFVNSLGAGVDKVGAINSEIQTLQTQMTGFTSIMRSAQAATDQFSTPIGRLPASLSALKQSLLDDGYAPTQLLGAAYQDLGNRVDDTQGQINGLNKILPGVTSAQNAQNAAIQQANQAMGEAAGYTGTLASQYGQLTTQLQSANQALQTAEGSLNTMLGTELSAAQATTAFYQSVGSLTTSLQTNGTQLDGTTSKALANQQAFEGVGSSIEGVIKSMESQGATSDQIVGKVQSLTGYLESQAGQYGLTTGQVDAYLTQLGLTPAQVKTDLELSNYSTASSQVAAYEAKLAAIPRAINITLNVDQTSNAAVPLTRASAFATGTDAAPGGPAMVGELGPEAMEYKGSWSIIGQHGPEIRNVPHGARILTASQTARLPRYADGVGNDGVTGLLGGEPTQLLAVTAYAVSQLPSMVQALGSSFSTAASNVVTAMTANTAALSTSFTTGLQVTDVAINGGFAALGTTITSDLQALDTNLSASISGLAALSTAGGPGATGTGSPGSTSTSTGTGSSASSSGGPPMWESPDIPVTTGPSSLVGELLADLAQGTGQSTSAALAAAQVLAGDAPSGSLLAGNLNYAITQAQQQAQLGQYSGSVWSALAAAAQAVAPAPIPSVSVVGAGNPAVNGWDFDTSTGMPVGGPIPSPGAVGSGNPAINPWDYNVDNPANNPVPATEATAPWDYNANQPKAVHVTYAPTYQVSGGLSGEALAQVQALDQASQDQLVQALVGALSG